MPLSKAKQAAWMKEYRNRIRYNVIPTTPVIPSVIPKTVKTDLTERARSGIVDARPHDSTPRFTPAMQTAVIPNVIPNQEKIAALRGLISSMEGKNGYNVIPGKRPLLDGDGHIIPWDD